MKERTLASIVKSTTVADWEIQKAVARRRYKDACQIQVELIDQLREALRRHCAVCAKAEYLATGTPGARCWHCQTRLLLLSETVE